MIDNTNVTEKNRDIVKPAGRRAHMANERTFLAWVRTAIGIMALGFVVEKFAYIGAQQPTPSPGLSQAAGLILVALGVMVMAFAFVRYRTIEKELDEGKYKPDLLLTTVLTIAVIAVGLFLIVYLMRIL